MLRFAIFGFFLAGCSCGVGAVPTNGTTARVAADGSVTYSAIAVGNSESFSIPVKESADTDETIVSASCANGAFEIVSTFPIYVPKGQTVNVEVAFAPTATGPTSADLVLQTAKMGSSHVALAGTGL